ncbi:IS5 family transposase [Streptomyces kaempferi]
MNCCRFPGWLAGRGGRPEDYCHRKMVDAVRSLVNNGVKWRAMPADFPSWPRVYAFFVRWRDTGLVTELHEGLREAVRRSEGRAPEPSAAVVDSQSIKADATVALDSRGFDAGRKINGRKWHLLTDTLGLVLTVLVTPASTTDRGGARTLLPTATGRFRRLARVWANGGYTGHLTDWTTQHLGLALDIVRRPNDVQGFQALPRRWVVDRSFAWLLRSRRLVRDYELANPGASWLAANSTHGDCSAATTGSMPQGGEVSSGQVTVRVRCEQWKGVLLCVKPCRVLGASPRCHRRISRTVSGVSSRRKRVIGLSRGQQGEASRLRLDEVGELVTILDLLAPHVEEPGWAHGPRRASSGGGS